MDLPNESPGVLADPTRARLFALLGELDRPASTGELAERLGLHVNGIRRQLERLQRADLLERRKVIRGRGRPHDEWSVSPDAEATGERPSGYADLSRWLARSIPPSAARLREVERTGREIGRELAPPEGGDLEQSFGLALTALGFRPSIETTDEGLSCSLGNCPYRDSVPESQELICTLHRGLTAGLLDGLAPGAELAQFEPRDPDVAGCLIGVSRPGAA